MANKAGILEENKAAAPNLPEKMADKSPDAPTFGMKVHNELTYRGVDFFLNSVVGVTTTFITNRTQAGKKYFGEPVANAGKKLVSLFTKNQTNIEAGGFWGSMFASIMVGGTSIIPFMMISENKKFKKNFSCKIDTLRYGEDEVKNNPSFEEAYKQIDQEPKKDFTTGMLARATVLFPMIAATMARPVNDKMVEWMYQPIAKGSKMLARGVGIKPNKLAIRGAEELVDGNKKFVSDWDFIHRTIGFDFGLTFIYSYCHEFAYKAFAKLRNTETKNPTELAVTNVSEASIAEIDNKQWTEKFPKRDASISHVAQLANQPSQSLEVGAT